MKKPAKKPLRLETQTIRSLDTCKLVDVAAGAGMISLPLAQTACKCLGEGLC